jgi:hypothetical protein
MMTYNTFECAVSRYFDFLTIDQGFQIESIGNNDFRFTNSERHYSLCINYFKPSFELDILFFFIGESGTIYKVSYDNLQILIFGDSVPTPIVKLSDIEQIIEHKAKNIRGIIRVINCLSASQVEELCRSIYEQNRITIHEKNMKMHNVTAEKIWKNKDVSGFLDYASLYIDYMDNINQKRLSYARKLMKTRVNQQK